MAQQIDPSQLQYQYRRVAGGDADNQKSTYGVEFSANGQNYTFVPDSVISKGVQAGDNTFVMPWFLDQNNLKSLQKNAIPMDLAGQSWYGDYLKDTVGASTTGFLIPSNSLPFDSQMNVVPVSQGNITGMSKVGDKLVYAQENKNGQNSHYFTSDGVSHSITPGSSLLEDTFGGVGAGLSDFVNSDLGKAAMLAAAYYGMQPELAAGAEGGFTGELPAGSAYAQPEVTTLGNIAGPTEGMASGTALSGLGENAYTAAQDATDLAGVSNAGGSGLTGVNAIGAANAYPALNAAAAGDAAAAGGNTAAALKAAGATAAGGTALADILPYTAGAGVVSALIGANAAQSGADAQSAAAQAGIAQQQKNFETINAQQAPYRAAGYNALNNIAGMTAGQTPQYDANGNVVKDANGNPVMTTGSGYFQHQFDANDLKNGLAPNYDFMLQQGQMANQRAANAGGGALGGNALQGLNKYTQDYAGNAYQNAFNNYQGQRTNIYNTLAGIAGIGQTGQNATNTAATNATNAATQLGVGSAAAQAAGATGTANAYGNALNNVTNQYTLASLLNQGGRVA